jgi:hypothetical protein
MRPSRPRPRRPHRPRRHHARATRPGPRPRARARSPRRRGARCRPPARRRASGHSGCPRRTRHRTYRPGRVAAATRAVVDEAQGRVTVPAGGGGGVAASALLLTAQRFARWGAPWGRNVPNHKANRRRRSRRHRGSPGCRRGTGCRCRGCTPGRRRRPRRHRDSPRCPRGRARSGPPRSSGRCRSRPHRHSPRCPPGSSGLRGSARPHRTRHRAGSPSQVPSMHTWPPAQSSRVMQGGVASGRD